MFCGEPESGPLERRRVAPRFEAEFGLEHGGEAGRPTEAWVGGDVAVNERGVNEVGISGNVSG